VIFFSRNRAIYEIMWRNRQASDGNKVHVLFMLAN